MNVEFLDRMLEKLESELPHGSGVNGKWSFKVVYQYTYSRIGILKIFANNTFEAMNENGFYCHNHPFTVQINCNEENGILKFETFLDGIEIADCHCNTEGLMEVFLEEKEELEEGLSFDEYAEIYGGGCGDFLEEYLSDLFYNCIEPITL